LLVEIQASLNAAMVRTRVARNCEIVGSGTLTAPLLLKSF